MEIKKIIKQIFCIHKYDSEGTFYSFGGPCPKYAYPCRRYCEKCGAEIKGLWEMRYPEHIRRQREEREKERGAHSYE